MEQIQIKGGARVYVDFELDHGRCRGCHKVIFWATTSNTKKMPICQNDKGEWISHFYDCPKAHLFRNKKEYEPNTNGINTDKREVKGYENII